MAPNRWKSAAFSLVLTAIGLLSGLYAFDAYLVVTRDPRGAIYHVTHIIPGFDHRQLWEVVLDLRHEGSKAYPALFPNGLQPVASAEGPLLPLGGISRVPTVLCNESGQYVTYDADRFGFNNPDAVWDLPADIVAVGDSFTRGFCPPAPAHMLSLIRDRLPGTVNLGQSGSGPLAELATLAEYLPLLKPATALWFFFEGNDLTDLENERSGSNGALYLKYLDGGYAQRLTTRQAEIDAHLVDFVEAGLAERLAAPRPSAAVSVGVLKHAWDTLLLRHVRQLIRKRFEAQDAEFTPDYALFERVLRRAQALSRDHATRLVLVYLPQSRYRSYRINSAELYPRVLEIAGRLGIEVIDIKREWGGGDAADTYFYYPGSHYNVLGNRLVAEVVLRQLQARAAAPR